MPNFSNNDAPKPVIGVSGIVFNDQQQVLLIKRNQAPACGLWSVPGGKLEAGESLAEACQREIKEETGLDVVPQTVVAIVERRIEGFHYVVIDFLAQLASTENYQPLAQTDVSDACWISLDDLNNYDLVEGLAEIIMRSQRPIAGDQLIGLHKISANGTDYLLP